MPISKLGQRRQVVIPKAICDSLGIKIGDFVEVRATHGRVVIKPKKLVDPEDVLTPEEETIVRRGVRQLKQRASKSWQQIKQEMDCNLSHDAEKQLARLPRNIQKRIGHVIDEMEDNPFRRAVGQGERMRSMVSQARRQVPNYCFPAHE